MGNASLTIVQSSLWVDNSDSILHVSYDEWNNILARYILATARLDEPVYLSASSAMLTAAWYQTRIELCSPKEIRDCFIKAVRRPYHTKVIEQRGDIGFLKATPMHDQPPYCLSFLTLSVLAAYEMKHDEQQTAAAYYPRLAELLGLHTQGRGNPVNGFNYDVCSSLWYDRLKCWLHKSGFQLALPSERPSGTHQYIDIPIMHAPLRRVDVEQLPEFFSKASYKPGDGVSHDRIKYDFGRLRLGEQLSTKGQQAVQSQPAAIYAQIAHELRSWSGEVVGVEGQVGSRQRRSVIHLNLDTEPEPAISFVASRPEGYPELFAPPNQSQTLESSRDGWYDPVPLSQQNEASLLNGFVWNDEKNPKLSVRWAGGKAFAFGPSEFAGYDSQAGLPFDTECAVLCCASMVEAVSNYLAKATAQPCQPTREGLPNGWYLFLNLRMRQLVEPPADLEVLRINQQLNIVLRGGLRLGRRNIWLQDCPPEVLIVGGSIVGDVATVDGKSVQVGKDGHLLADQLLQEPGEHTIKFGNEQRQVRVQAAHLPSFDKGLLRDVEDRCYPVPLPAGKWRLLGAQVNQVVNVTVDRGRGEVRYCTFKPMWALRHHQQGVEVLCLQTEPMPPADNLPYIAILEWHSSVCKWAETIVDVYTTAPSQVRFGGFSPAVNGWVADLWSKYVSTAEAIYNRTTGS